jgi:hypothetical protein
MTYSYSIIGILKPENIRRQFTSGFSILQVMKLGIASGMNLIKYDESSGSGHPILILWDYKVLCGKKGIYCGRVKRKRRINEWDMRVKIM